MSTWRESQRAEVTIRPDAEEVGDVDSVGKRFRPDQVFVVYVRSRSEVGEYTPWRPELPVVSGFVLTTSGKPGKARVRERVYERHAWLESIIAERTPDA